MTGNITRSGFWSIAKVPTMVLVQHNGWVKLFIIFQLHQGMMLEAVMDNASLGMSWYTCTVYKYERQRAVLLATAPPVKAASPVCSTTGAAKYWLA